MPPRDLTAKDIASWLTPHDAIALLKEAFGDAVLLESVLIQRLTGGMVQAVAGHSTWENDMRPRQVLIPIPSDHWRQYSYQGFHKDFWKTADSNADGSHNSGHVTYFSVRFEPQGIHAITASAPKKPAPATQVTPETTNSPNKGGRPRKEWWDDFWIEIFRQIYLGKLVPKKQADLERAMLDWAINHGHEVSEATVRKAARRLFAALNLEG